MALSNVRGFFVVVFGKEDIAKNNLLRYFTQSTLLHGFMREIAASKAVIFVKLWGQRLHLT